MKQTCRYLLIFILSYVISVNASIASDNFKPRMAEPVLEDNAWVTIESLPNDQVNNMTVDSKNTLWLGAPNGIVHYDGKNIVRFNTDDGLPTGLIYHVKESHAGNMLALSRKQMFEFKDNRWQKYGPKIVPNLAYQRKKNFTEHKDSFWFIRGNSLVSLSKTNIRSYTLLDEKIVSFVIDQNGLFWLLGSSGSVKVYSSLGFAFNLIKSWPSLVNLQGEAAQITALKNGDVWLLTEHLEQPPLRLTGYALPKSKNSKPLKKLENITWSEVKYPSRRGYNDKAIKMLPNGNIVIANNRQLVVKTPKSWLVKNLRKLGINNTVSNITSSNDGAIWVLEKNNGVKRLNYLQPKQVKYLDLILGCENNDTQYFIHKSSLIIQHKPQENSWHKFKTGKNLISTPNNILCTRDNMVIVYGSDGNKSAISYRNNLASINEPWKKIVFDNHGTLIGQYSALETKNGDIYLGNNDEKIAKSNLLVKLSKGQKNHYQVTYLPIGQRVSSIAELSNNELVLGAFNLNLYNQKTKSRLALPDHLLSNWIEDLRVDLLGQLWVATWDYGIFKYHNARWTQLSVNYGLRNTRVSSLLPLPNNEILALTSEGVDRFDGRRWQSTDIAGVSSIREGSNLLTTSDGAIWVNQATRDWMFRAQEPEINNQSISKNSKHEDFYSIKYLPNALAPIISASIEQSTEQHSDSVFISWQAQDQWFETPSDKLQYSYRLNQNEWSAFSLETSSYFNHLDAGDYLFEVKARDGDGNVSEYPAQIAFVIQAAFWQKSWFLILVIAMPIIILVLLFMLVAQRLKASSRLNEARMQFLTNISHELRNPLALVITPLEDLVSKNQQSTLNTGLELALRNSKRLKQLIDQLLEYRRLHSGHTQLTEQEGDLVSFIKLAINDLTYIAESKKQNISFEHDSERYLCRFDHDVMRKIIDNLTTNAIKYSPEDTNIHIVLSSLGNNQKSEGVSISIEDQGIGISNDEQKSIFKPFYTPLDRSFGNDNSFGIGLAFVKDLVSLCFGKIDVQSPPIGKKQGSIFTLVFDKMINVTPVLISPAVTDNVKPYTESEIDESPKIKLLLVDDNTELVLYLKSALEDDFDCHTEFNGESALAYANANIPDVILSDVRMPKMDGLALCKALKENLATSHIPLLLHSAVISEQHQLSGLAVGAVDYLAKPASVELIRSRVKNLINDREKFAKRLHQNLLQQNEVALNQEIKSAAVAKYSQLSSDNSSTDYREMEIAKDSQVANNALDIDSDAFRESLSDINQIKFIDQVKTQVHQNYSDGEFNAEKLSEALFMSRSAFYRKFKALTNITPAEYIKVFRLNQAAHLLLQGESVAQVSEKSGYSEASSFNRAFKNHFGCAPSKYK